MRMETLHLSVVQFVARLSRRKAQIVSVFQSGKCAFTSGFIVPSLTHQFLQFCRQQRTDRTGLLRRQQLGFTQETGIEFKGDLGFDGRTQMCAAPLCARRR